MNRDSMKLIRSKGLMLRYSFPSGILLAVECDFCGARVGHGCRTRKVTTRWYNGFQVARRWPSGPHDARVLAARALTRRCIEVVEMPIERPVEKKHLLRVAQ
jgi:hypothetical protein